MQKLTFGFIGLGLIGGSIAKAIKKLYREDATIIAYDINKETLSLAAKDKIVDLPCQTISSAFSRCHYIFLCAEVTKNDKNLIALKQYLADDCLLTDVGSVKTGIHHMIQELNLDHCFIGGHPMAGSEKSGYANASERLLENAYYILTPSASVSAQRIAAYENLISSLGALPLILDFKQHDYVTAAISHLPHVIASSLVSFIKSSDSEEGIMKLIAAGGFKDITRIASSSADMWQQICLSNRENIVLLLEHYIESLQTVKKDLMESDENALHHFFQSARDYRDSFQDISSGPIKKIYGFYVDIPDETGVISTISTILAKECINIKNIGIIHNREFEDGVLRIEFYDELNSQNAVALLTEKGYTLYKR